MDSKAMLVRWQETGLSGREFCRREGIAYSTFNYWKRRWHEIGDQFVAIEVSGNDTETGLLEIELETATLRFANLPPAEWLIELLGLDA